VPESDWCSRVPLRYRPLRIKKVLQTRRRRRHIKEGLDFLHQRATASALENFRKADKQDGGHCTACQQKMIKYGVELGDWKTAETASQEIIAEAQGDKNVALAHYQFGIVLMDEGLNKRKDEFFARAHDEMTKALAAYPKFPDAIYVDGRALAHLKQDDAAKAQFEQFVKLQPEDSPDRHAPCDISASQSWPAQGWPRHSRSQPSTDSESLWTT
jgi:tetratricopeptide (TPR) repeat protein